MPATLRNGADLAIGVVRTPRRMPASLHLEGGPVLDAHDRAAARIPLVDAVILARAEVVVLGPLDRTAAQALGVDLEVGHGGRELFGARRPARRLQRRLHDHAGD